MIRAGGGFDKGRPRNVNGTAAPRTRLRRPALPLIIVPSATFPCRRANMAAIPAFKIQCPSCEAMVTIRDDNLIGKKVACPKCKYRFVVEKPEEEAADVDLEEDDSPKKAGAAG